MKILTKEKFIEDYKNPKYAQKAVNYLEEKRLLPLHSNPMLASITGHLIGDGSLSKDPYVGEFRFFGTQDKLLKIKEKISQIFKIKPKKLFEKEHGFVLRYNNCRVARVLSLIGVPRGNKVMKEFDVPKWIKESNTKIIKAFLVALCDDELSSPRRNKKGYVEPLRLKFNKSEEILERQGFIFLENVRNLFIKFEINCNPIRMNNDKYITKEGKVTRSVYFNISAKRKNLLNFRKQIGFETEKDKITKLDRILCEH
jgi:hypothetical protein